MSADYQTIVKALQYLSSVCDGAQSQDGHGFNGRDSQFGKSLAAQSLTRTLSESQQNAAIKMLQTYRTQLANVEIELPQQITYRVYRNGNKPQANKPQANQPKEEIKISGKIELDRGKLVIRFPYNPELVSRVKSLSDRAFNPDKKLWTTPTRIADEVMAKFPEFEVSPDVLALMTKNQELAKIANVASSDFEITGLKGEPLPYQNAGVEFLELAGGRGIIADQMGLGKTLQSLGYLQIHPDLRPAIIIVPASLKINWTREISKWLSTQERVMILSGTKANPLEIEYNRPSIIIINYDILPAWIDTLSALNAKIMIADEAHYCKNSKSQRSKATTALARKIPHTILLTGTPVTNRPLELFPLLNMVDPQAWPSFFPFAKRYCGAVNTGWGWDFNGATNLTELHEKIKPYVVRRTKEQVLKELPAKRRVTLPVEMDDKLKREYERTIIEAKEAIEEALANGEILGAAHLVLIEKSKQAAVAAKMKQAINWIGDFIESGQKLVLFATHKIIIDEIMANFGEQAVKVTGDDSQQERQQSVDRFQNDDQIRLFVGNIKAAGVGLTLTAASDVAFLEFAWTPGDHDQAEDRTHRIGQTENVTAWYLVAAGTIDEKIISLLEQKRIVVDHVTDGQEGELKFSIFGELVKEIVKGDSTNANLKQ